MEYQDAREDMVRFQIAGRGIHHPELLDILRKVPRHRFVPASRISSAYEDRALANRLGQTISQPYIVALMTDMLQTESGCRVLEIGTGSGYQTAILAELSGEVCTMDIYPELQKEAELRLTDMGYRNIRFRAGNGFNGWPEAGSFDRIIVTAAPENLPEKLLDQLATGGIMIIPIGPRNGIQYLWRIIKRDRGELKKEKLLAVRFVPLIEEVLAR